MPARYDHFKIASRRRLIPFKAWREWCFLRTAANHLKWRATIMGVVLLGGGLLFQRFEPEKHLSLFEAMYYTWSLVFGEPPEAFPRSNVLRALFFLVPVLGLTVIIEGLVDFAFLLRDRKRYEDSWCRTMAALMSDHVIIVGFGRLGYRTFRLLRKVEQPVVVIERNPQSRFLDELRREGSPVLIGDARDDALLEEAGVRKARSIILATDDDLGNLEIALDARRVKPDIRVVVRMFDQNMADKVRDAFNIQIAMSQASISAPAFAMSALDANIVNSFVVGDQLVVMVKWLVKPRGPLDGVAVGRIMEDLRCGVAELRRDSEPPVLFPPPETVLRAGDRVMVQGPFDALEKLKASIA